MIMVERPVPLGFKEWFESPKDGCVVCLDLMDAVMHKYRSKVPALDGSGPYLKLLRDEHGPW
jgi:hypothetical protein